MLNLPEGIQQRYSELNFDDYEKVLQYLSNHPYLLKHENAHELPNSFEVVYLENGENFRTEQEKRKIVSMYPKSRIDDFFTRIARKI